MKFQKQKPRWNSEKLHVAQQKVQNILEEKVSEFECKNKNMETLWNSIKNCMLGIMRDVAGRVERKGRKPWIAQENYQSSI